MDQIRERQEWKSKRTKNGKASHVYVERVDGSRIVCREVGRTTMRVFTADSLRSGFTLVRTAT